jgi:mRNA interferase HigB
MRIIALSTLKAYWEKRVAYRDAEQPVLAWYRAVKSHRTGLRHILLDS